MNMMIWLCCLYSVRCIDCRCFDVCRIQPLERQHTDNRSVYRSGTDYKSSGGANSCDGVRNFQIVHF